MNNRIDFSNLNTESKNILTKGKAGRKPKKDKADNRITIYLTNEQANALYGLADKEHITLRDYILKKTIYND